MLYIKNVIYCQIQSKNGEIIELLFNMATLSVSSSQIQHKVTDNIFIYKWIWQLKTINIIWNKIETGLWM